MSSILSAFNKHLIEFIQDIIRIFPEDKNLKITLTALNTVRRINPKSIIVIWKKHITDKYKKEIAEGNPEFFIQKNYTEDIEGQADADNILKAIEQLRSPIKDMGEDNKKKAIKYIQNLTKMTELYFA